MTGQTSSGLDVAAMFTAMDRGDLDTTAGFLHPHVVVSLGNLEPIHGLEAFVAQYAQVTSQLAGIRHEIHDVWTAREDDAITVARMTVHYTRTPGDVVSLPCCNVFRVADGLIADYRVFIDMSPLGAPPPDAAASTG
jgi:ketosteroid isomerase-like protein